MQYITKNFSEISEHETRDRFISLLCENNIKSPENFYQWLYMSSYTRSNLRTRVIYYNNQLIGFGSILFFNLDSLRIGSLVNLYIEKKHRTLGPALILERSLLDSIHGKDCDLLIAKPNEKAERVFSRLGYKKNGKMRRYTFVVNFAYYLTKKNYILKLSNFFVKPIILSYFKVLTWTSCLKFPACGSVELEFVDHPEKFFEVNSKFHYWRYFESSSEKYKVCRLKTADNKAAFIVYHLSGSVLTIDDIRNAEISCKELLICHFILNVISKYELRNINFAGLVGSEFLGVLTTIGFVERVDDSAQTIFSKECNQTGGNGFDKALQHFLFPTNLDF